MTGGRQWMQIRATLDGHIRIINPYTLQKVGEIVQPRAQNPVQAVELFMRQFPEGTSLDWRALAGGDMVCFAEMEIEVVKEMPHA